MQATGFVAARQSVILMVEKIVGRSARSVDTNSKGTGCCDLHVLKWWQLTAGGESIAVVFKMFQLFKYNEFNRSGNSK
jgi:hypothetical protein